GDDRLVVGPLPDERLDLGLLHGAAPADEAEDRVGEDVLSSQLLQLVELVFPPGRHVRMLSDRRPSDNFPAGQRPSASAFRRSSGCSSYQAWIDSSVTTTSRSWS